MRRDMHTTRSALEDFLSAVPVGEQVVGHQPEPGLGADQRLQPPTSS